PARIGTRHESFRAAGSAPGGGSTGLEAVYRMKGRPIVPPSDARTRWGPPRRPARLEAGDALALRPSRFAGAAEAPHRACAHLGAAGTRSGETTWQNRPSKPFGARSPPSCGKAWRARAREPGGY